MFACFSERKWPTLFTFLTAIIIFVSARFTWPDGDDGRYAVWAIAIARGEGITNIHLPEPTPEVAVPPGLSLALAPFVMLFENIEARLKAMMMFSPFLLVLLAWVFSHWVVNNGRWTMGDGQQDRTSTQDNHSIALSPQPSISNLASDGHRPSPIAHDPWSIVSVCIIGVWGVFTTSSAWRIHTEILYMLLSISCLALWPRRSAPWWSIVIPGLIAGAAFMTRTVGLALLPAGLLALLVRRQWKHAAVFGAGFALVNLPLTWRAMHLAGTPLGYSQYAGESGLMDKAHTLLHLFPHYLFYGLPDLMFYRLVGADGLLAKLNLALLAQPVAWTIGSLIVAGFLLSIFRFDVTDLYAAGYLVIISLFNQPDYAARGEFLFQDRYVIPVIPIAAIYIVRALTAMGGCHRYRIILLAAPAILAGMTLYVVATAAGAGISRYRTEAAFRGLHPMDPARYGDLPNENDRAWGRYFECAFQLSSMASPDAVVIGRKPYEVYLASGCKAIRYLDVGAGANLLNFMETYRENGAYLLEDAFSADTAFGREREAVIKPLLQQFSERFELVYETKAPVSRVWRLR